MKKSYLDRFYPDGMSAELRLFNAGARCTRVSLASWRTTIIIGVIISVIGLIVSAVDYELMGFGMFLFGAGDLIASIGIIGLVVYFNGLRYLERAELLYNTRLAGREEEDVAAPNPFYRHTPASSSTSSRPVPNGWVCTCGKTNAEYMTSCSCGVSKQQAKLAAMSKKNP